MASVTAPANTLGNGDGRTHANSLQAVPDPRSPIFPDVGVFDMDRNKLPSPVPSQRQRQTARTEKNPNGKGEMLIGIWPGNLDWNLATLVWLLGEAAFCFWAAKVAVSAFHTMEKNFRNGKPDEPE